MCVCVYVCVCACVCTCPLLQPVASECFSSSEQVFGTSLHAFPTFFPGNTQTTLDEHLLVQMLWRSSEGPDERVNVSSCLVATACTGPTLLSPSGSPPQERRSPSSGPSRPKPRPGSSSSSSPTSGQRQAHCCVFLTTHGVLQRSLWGLTRTRSVYPVSLAVHHG